MRPARLLIPALTLGLALNFAGCDILDRGGPSTPKTIALSPLGHELVGQSNAFGVDLFVQTAAEESGNLMLSPLSASIALTMLLNGTDGDTYTQLRDALGYDPNADLDAINRSYQGLRDQLLGVDRKVQLAIANGAFYDRAFSAGSPFKAPFLTALREAFGASVEGLNFADPASVGVVNGWASKQTRGRVPKVLDEIDPDHVLFLMNAVYFKGEWSSAFERGKTSARPFHLADGSTVQVPTMDGRVEARGVRGEGYEALELPYGRRNFSLVVLVPDAPLAGFRAGMNGTLWADVTRRLDAQDEWRETWVQLPRFSFSSDEELNEPLKALGVRDAFNPRLANLSRMNDAALKVSFVKQNTFVDVNEEGTEAAAVTTVGVVLLSLPRPFAVDRPFVFAIRERTTNTLLFIGQVTNPAR